jgi:hypothetical protein
MHKHCTSNCAKPELSWVTSKSQRSLTQILSDTSGINAKAMGSSSIFLST